MDRTQIALIVLAVSLFLFGIRMGASRQSLPTGGESVSHGPLHTEDAPEAASADATKEGTSAAAPTGAVPQEYGSSELATLSNGVLDVVVSSEGGRIQSARLSGYKSRIDEESEPVDLSTDTEHGLLSVGLGPDLPGAEVARYHITERSEQVVESTLSWSNGAEVVKRLEIDPRGYGGSLSVTVRNRGTGTIRPEFDLQLFGREPPQTGGGVALQNHRIAAYGRESGLVQHTIPDLERPGFFRRGGPLRQPAVAPIDWVAVESQYFLASALSEGSGHSAELSSLGLGAGRVTLAYPQREIGPDQQIERRYRLYLGPKVEESVDAVDARLEPALVVGYAWVRPVTRIFARILNWVHEHVIANYGVGIIAITLVLRMAMFPLTQRSMQSMRRMSVIAPQLKEIQEKHRDDPQRQQQELMALYKRTGINPLTAVGSGCGPMMLQMPFMIALYFALQGMIELRHAPFVFWINDLSSPENFFSVLGVPIRPLALLMGGSMFLQTYLQPGSKDAQQQQQRQMMLIMSGVFVLMFYSFPSGLVLYWLVSNLLGIAQQLTVNRAGLIPGAAATK